MPLAVPGAMTASRSKGRKTPPVKEPGRKPAPVREPGPKPRKRRAA
jgi:hypothetical protein